MGFATAKGSAVAGEDVYLGPGADPDKIDVQVGPGYRELSPAKCREFAASLNRAADEVDARKGGA